MAAVCEICGKGPGFGKSVSHSHRRTSRRWDPNIQTVHVVTHPGGNKKRINVVHLVHQGRQGRARLISAAIAGNRISPGESASAQ